jgi:CheY-like chemotaxis protein
VSNADLRGAGTVLVVDDEEIITSFSRSALEPYGYSVLVARDGPEATRIFQERSADIGLVLLDVALPGMDGLETLERIREIRPDIRVIVCSGIGDQEVETHFAGKDIVAIFPKPYTSKQLARKVKECMPPTGAAEYL